jgi:hypothetical protein
MTLGIHTLRTSMRYEQRPHSTSTPWKRSVERTSAGTDADVYLDVVVVVDVNVDLDETR